MGKTAHVSRIITLPLSLFFIAVLSSCLDQPGTTGSEGETASTAVPYLENVNQPSNLVCDALNGAVLVSTDPTAGLVANLFYLDSSQPRYSSVNDYITNGHPITNATLYFNEINVPTRPFDRGFFTNEGQTILNNQGNTLYEYFGLEFMTDIILAAEDPEGDYQFAVLADDGAILSTRGESGNPLDVIVNDDGTHPTKFGCGTYPINMSRSTRLPVNFRYFQGPRYHISAMILYRPWPTDSNLVNDVECGKSGNSRYFDSTQNPPTAQAAFNGLLSRGWKVLQSANYKVPRGIENSCNVPAPTISNETLVSVTSTSADFTWTTDVPSTSQIEYVNVSTGQVSVTTIDTLLIYNHAFTATGLTPNTLYNATVISSSASGKSTRGTQITFRTRR